MKWWNILISKLKGIPEKEDKATKRIRIIKIKRRAKWLG